MSSINRNIKKINKINTNKYKKTIRNKNLLYKTKQYYETKYKDTELLPRTPIFNYIFNNFPNYEKEKQTKEVPFTFEDGFSLSNELKNINYKTSQLNIEGKLLSNPNFTLDKFIAYCFYITDSPMFRDSNKELSINSFIQNVKNQTGKDVQRTELTINNVLENNEIYSEFGSDNYLKADRFVSKLLTILTGINKIIDYNILNKILLLTCQNVLNAMISILNLYIQDIFTPADRRVIMLPLKLEKSMILDKENILFNVYFNSSILISNYNQDIDPETPCGTLEYNLALDLKKSSYECNIFKIEWDLNQCAFYKPETQTQRQTQTQTINNQGEKKTNKKFKDYWKEPKVAYGMAAGISAAGIASVPFLLGLLGGKTKKKKILRKKRKTRRRRSKK
jgi:hypothetical protein